MSLWVQDCRDLMFLTLYRFRSKKWIERVWTWCLVWSLYILRQWPYKVKVGCRLDNTSSPFWSFVSLFSSPSLTLLCLSILDTHTHTHTPFLCLASFHVLLLFSSHQHFLQQAIGFTPATSILRVMAVVAHKAGTLPCDVARCPTAALHNPVCSLCWLDWSVFTQAPLGPVVTLRHWGSVSPLTPSPTGRFRREGVGVLSCKTPHGTFLQCKVVLQIT